eukprot:scaffold5358_cov62-Attheya_sp.AAC.1
MFVALGSIASAKKSEDTAIAITQLLNYAATNPDATVRYIASDMCLKIHSDASYLSEPKARSRAGGHFFLSSHQLNPPSATSIPPPRNGAIHTLCQIMKVVLASATEAELGAAFFAAKDGVLCRTILEEMGHPQPPTPLQVDNSCAVSIVNNTIANAKCNSRFFGNQEKKMVVTISPNIILPHHRRVRPTYLHVVSNVSSQHYFTAKVGNISGEGVLIGARPSPPGYPQKHYPTAHSRPFYTNHAHNII